MILLGQNQSNFAYLTLSEAVTLTSTTPYFLFRFISNATNENVLFSSPNITTAITRYDQFLITLTGATSPNLNYSAGTISLEPIGQWRYEVYEMYDPSNLFLSGTSGVILESGIVMVTGNSLVNIVDEYTGQTQTYGYYQP